MSGVVRLGLAAAAVGAILISGLLGVYSIDETERGVLKRGGAVVGLVEPGWHLKVPIYETIETVTTRTDRTELRDLETLTSTQQVVKMRVSVLYTTRPEQVVEKYRRLAGVRTNWNTFVDPLMFASTKTEVGRSTPETLVSDRAGVTDRILARMRSEAEALGWPVTLEGLRIEHIEFTPEYQAAQEASLAAVRMVAALGSVENYLAWQRVQKWNGVLPTTMPPGETSTVLGIGPFKKPD